MIAMVTRLVDMKGLDLVTRVLDEILYYDDIQFVVLGTGDPAFEHWFREAAGRYPLKMSAQLAFSEPLSRKIYAASDMYLMPSRFEPCGISQLLALRYGSIPIVRETKILTIPCRLTMSLQGKEMDLASRTTMHMIC